ncbi:MAG TPA: VOC family protein [Terriglobia bacterium]
MPNIEKHSPGSFCWIELHTTDQAAAKKFYGMLFGWQANDVPLGPGDFYTFFRLQDRDAAAACTLRPEQRAQGVPPHWMLYVTVDSADQAAARAAQLGGEAVAPPFDVGDSGRMAILQDPSGAAIAVWEPKNNHGTGIGGVDGTLCWADLSTSDRDRAGAFYSELFGWKIGKEDEDPAHAYWHLMNGEEFIGGIPPATHRQPNVPSHWQVYFAVSDCDATAAQAKDLGAQFFVPPTTFEDVGRMAVLADPQGAVFAIFKASPR